MQGQDDNNRSVIKITGGDREVFLQGLLTNDIRKVAQAPVYASILTPQGKYIADFILVTQDEAILLDVAKPMADGLLKRLMMYRLRADVALEMTDLVVTRGLGRKPDGAFDDPRHPALGWRAYGKGGGGEVIDWDAIRVEHCIPESGIELIPNETYILEAGFERLNGVDFRKGCYVGQEVTARMKHKTELRKGFAKVLVEGEAACGTPITAEGREVGTLYTRAGDQAIAYLRFDRAEGMMQAGEAKVRLA